MHSANGKNAPGESVLKNESVSFCDSRRQKSNLTEKAPRSFLISKLVDVKETSRGFAPQQPVQCVSHDLAQNQDSFIKPSTTTIFRSSGDNFRRSFHERHLNAIENDASRYIAGSPAPLRDRVGGFLASRCTSATFSPEESFDYVSYYSKGDCSDFTGHLSSENCNLLSVSKRDSSLFENVFKYLNMQSPLSETDSIPVEQDDFLPDEKSTEDRLCFSEKDIYQLSNLDSEPTFEFSNDEAFPYTRPIDVDAENFRKSSEQATGSISSCEAESVYASPGGREDPDSSISKKCARDQREAGKPPPTPIVHNLHLYTNDNFRSDSRSCTGNEENADSTVSGESVVAKSVFQSESENPPIVFPVVEILFQKEYKKEENVTAGVESDSRRLRPQSAAIPACGHNFEDDDRIRPRARATSAQHTRSERGSPFVADKTLVELFHNPLVRPRTVSGALESCEISQPQQTSKKLMTPNLERADTFAGSVSSAPPPSDFSDECLETIRNPQGSSRGKVGHPGVSSRRKHSGQPTSRCVTPALSNFSQLTIENCEVLRHYEQPTLASRLKRSKTGTTPVSRDFPFVAGTSTGRSHNLQLNVQTVRSAMKMRQSPSPNRVSGPGSSQPAHRGRKMERIAVPAAACPLLSKKYPPDLEEHTNCHSEDEDDYQSLATASSLEDKVLDSEEVWVVNQDMKSVDRCNCYPRNLTEYGHVIRPYLKSRAVCKDEGVAENCWELAYSENQSLKDIGDEESSVYSFATHHQEEARRLREVLMKLRDDFAELRLQRNAIRSATTSMSARARRLKNIERELKEKDDEIYVITTLYQQVVDLRGENEELRRVSTPQDCPQSRKSSVYSIFPQPGSSTTTRLTRVLRHIQILQDSIRSKSGRIVRG